MNSGMFVDEGSIRLAGEYEKRIVKIGALTQVFTHVYGEVPVGLSLEDVILRTIKVVGNSAWVDKNLAKMYLAAVIQFGIAEEFSDMVIQAANEIFGISFNSIEEVGITLDYEMHPENFNGHSITKKFEIVEFPECPEMLKEERIIFTVKRNTPPGFKWRMVLVGDKEITVTYARVES